ncbi:MAG: hypothetical protein K2Q01_11055, partial [Rickettsiales bacterium]|nr:hypothetical protein [Rickettsiales bacterium]
MKAVSPPKENVALPTVEKPAAAAPGFPLLPPSRPCAEEDMRGLYRLSAVYEDPAGPETSNFQSAPYQYIVFRKNNLFSRVNMEADNVAPATIVKKAQDHSSGLMQYLLQDNGFIYFYQNSVAVDVQACFVVADDK